MIEPRRIASRAGGWLLWGALFLGGSLLSCSSNPPIPHYAESDRGGDKDNDGIADQDDACPNDAEDGLPPKANDGCPASDPDGDGVMLADDKCPNAKEDGEPPAPSDGCPAKDSDGDGVADAEDKCPDNAEDDLPPDAGDGCPAPDADGDGVPDVLDKCAAQAETRNGFRDDDGCPDDVPPGGVAFDAESNEIWVADAERVAFKPGGADFVAPSEATLAKVATVLKAHPEIARVEIEVHTTSKGDAQANAALADQRAHAVAGVLATDGVAKGELVAIGYGEYCPAVDKGDDADEPRNERVLFKTVVVHGVWQPVQRGCWRAQAAGIDPTKRASEGPAVTYGRRVGGG